MQASLDLSFLPSIQELRVPSPPCDTAVHGKTQVSCQTSEFLPVPGVHTTSSLLPGFRSKVKIFNHLPAFSPLSTREIPHYPLESNSRCLQAPTASSRTVPSPLQQMQIRVYLSQQRYKGGICVQRCQQSRCFQATSAIYTDPSPCPWSPCPASKPQMWG